MRLLLPPVYTWADRITDAYRLSRRSPQLKVRTQRESEEMELMAKVIVPLGMSLDGFIAAANDGFDNPDDGMRLFQWYFDGDTPIRQYQEAASRGVATNAPFALSACSAAVFQDLVDSTGAVVAGRRTYDVSNEWGGNGPIPKRPLFIVTHRVPEAVPQGESTYTFVTDGVDSAIKQAKAAAGDKYVSLMGATVPQQCLRAGLLDEIQIHLIPTLLGSGTRLFEHLGDRRIELETIGVVECPGVTHLRFRVAK
jgi:dihydrofolate reductase